MKKTIICTILALIVGFWAGYRLTILNAHLTLFSEQVVEVEVWGRADLYVADMAPEADYD